MATPYPATKEDAEVVPVPANRNWPVSVTDNIYTFPDRD